MSKTQAMKYPQMNLKDKISTKGLQTLTNETSKDPKKNSLTVALSKDIQHTPVFHRSPSNHASKPAATLRNLESDQLTFSFKPSREDSDDKNDRKLNSFDEVLGQDGSSNDNRNGANLSRASYLQWKQSVGIKDSQVEGSG